MNYLLKMKFKHFLIGVLIISASMVLMFFTWFNVLEDDLMDESEVEITEKVLVSRNQTEAGVPQEVETSDSEDEIERFGLVNNFTELDDGTYHDFQVDRVIPPVLSALKATEEQQLPIIVWWTGFTGETGKIKQCFVGNCYISANTTYLNHPLTKAFLFYGTDLDIDDLPLPRKAHHEWGLLHEESPKNNALFFYKEVLEQFNHTSTFKQQSHYPIPSQHITSESYLLKPLAYTAAEKNQIKKEKNISSVVYIQSGCNPPSDRDSYIQELMKHINIDSYGKCLHNRDLEKEFQDPLTMHNQNFLEFLQQYKFMISFENAICDDYMTEKLFRTFHVGVLPIYKGASNVREWLPDDKSAVIVDDFANPKELAEFITYLDSNDEEYDKYFEYKKTGLMNAKLKKNLDERPWAINSVYRMSFITGFECHVCDQIHRNKKANNALLFQGRLEHYGCPKPEKYPYDSPVGSESWERDTWIWDYEEGQRRAKKFISKILNTK